MDRWEKHESHRTSQDSFRVILVENKQKALPIRKRLISEIMKELLLFLKIDYEEISFYFVTEKKITDLHRQFFQDPTPTDCISFPIDEKHLGEVFVCPAVAIEYAKKHNTDPLKETILYAIHGLLHLLKYDDMDPESKKTMRRMEKKCINHLKKTGKISP